MREHIQTGASPSYIIVAENLTETSPFAWLTIAAFVFILGFWVSPKKLIHIAISLLMVAGLELLLRNNAGFGEWSFWAAAAMAAVALVLIVAIAGAFFARVVRRLMGVEPPPKPHFDNTLICAVASRRAPLLCAGQASGCGLQRVVHRRAHCSKGPQFNPAHPSDCRRAHCCPAHRRPAHVFEPSTWSLLFPVHIRALRCINLLSSLGKSTQ